MKERTVNSAGLKVSDSEFVHLSKLERFSDGSGYRGEVDVRAGEFACHGRVFYFDDLPGFVEQLRAMHTTLKGHAELKPRYEEEFVRLELDAQGHVNVTGLLRDYGAHSCSLRFGFQADQTFIPGFLSELEDLLRGLHA